LPELVGAQRAPLPLAARGNDMRSGARDAAVDQCAVSRGEERLDFTAQFGIAAARAVKVRTTFCFRKLRHRVEQVFDLPPAFGIQSWLRLSGWKRA
jgi:hypothetical protein